MISLIVALMLQGCMGRRALATERPYTAPANGSTIWYINSVPRNTDETGIHRNLLVTFEISDTSKTASCFASTTSGDSTFSFSRQFTNEVFMSKRGYLPFKATLGSGDAPWYMNFGRKSALFRVPVNQQTEQWKYVYDKSYVFAPEPEVIEIYSCNPIPLVNNNGFLNIHVIENLDRLLALRGATLLLDVQFTGNKDYAGLWNITYEGSDLQTDWHLWSPAEEASSFQLSADRGKEWASPASGIKYPVHLTLRNEDTGESFSIRPAGTPEQEVFMKKSSFWMGGIHVYSGETLAGRGNMIIFTR